MPVDAHFQLCPLLGNRKMVVVYCASDKNEEGKGKSILSSSQRGKKISLFQLLIIGGFPRARAANSSAVCSKANTGNCAQNKTFQ